MTVPLMSSVIVLGTSAADSNACTRPTLPIILSCRESRPSQPWRLTQSRRVDLERRPRAQTNRLPIAAADPAPPATATESSPLSP
jgi:hypothetical protein